VQKAGYWVTNAQAEVRHSDCVRIYAGTSHRRGNAVRSESRPGRAAITGNTASDRFLSCM